MRINSGEVKLNLIWKEDPRISSKQPIMFLHGFTGNSSEWHFFFDTVNPHFNPIAIDLIGHGESDSPNELNHYTILSITKQFDSIIKKIPNKIILHGYSMGGRVLLNYLFLTSRINKIKAIILESTSCGIENPIERKARENSDLTLAEKILKNGVENFIDDWMQKPIFSGLKNLESSEYTSFVKKKKLNSKIGLANSLKGFGTGKMDYLGNRLNEIEIPVLLLNGENDQKFVSINKKMKSRFINAKHVIIENCGHNIHLEKPSEFLNFVNHFLTKIG